MLLPQVFTGLPLVHRAFSVYPPTVSDIIGNPLVRRYEKLLTLSQEDIWDDLTEKGLAIDSSCPTPFDILLAQCADPSSAISALTRMAFEYFCHEKVAISMEGKIIVFLSEGWDKVEDIQDAKCIADNETYFSFQNFVRAVMGEDLLDPPEIETNPRVAAIKAKFRKSKRILKEAKRPDGLTLTTSLVALCHMGLGLNPLNIGDIPYASVAPLISMGANKEKYLVDASALAAHADPKKVKLKPWLKNPES